MIELAWYVVIMLVAAVVLWAIVRTRKHAVTIVVENGRIRRMYGVAQAKQQRIANFLADAVPGPRPVTILGDRYRDGSFHFRIRGPLDPGLQQQIRNFLKMEL